MKAIGSTPLRRTHNAQTDGQPFRGRTTGYEGISKSAEDSFCINPLVSRCTEQHSRLIISIGDYVLYEEDGGEKERTARTARQLCA
jgi:hypothetical protein